MRAGTTEWVSGVACAAIGARILVEPRQIYGAIQPYNIWVGAVLVISGGFLLLTLTGSRHARQATLAHVLVGMELLMLGLSQAPLHFLTSTVSLSLLALGTFAAAVLPTRRGRIDGKPAIDLFVVVAALTIALCGGILLAVPPTFARESAVDLDGLQPWYGLGLAGAGLMLLVAELGMVRWRLVRGVIFAVVGAAFWSYVLLVAVPAKSAIVGVYWAGSGLLLPVLPWLGPRLRRLGRASLRTRFAVVLAGVTALALVTVISVDVSRDEVVLANAVLTQQRLVAMAIVSDFATTDTPPTVEEVSRRIESAKLTLNTSDQRIYLVDRKGRAIEADRGAADPHVADAISRTSGSGTVRYSADDGERLAAFAPIDGVDSWVVVERTALESVIGVDETADYLIMLVIIVIAAVVGAVAAAPLVAPLRALSAAAEKLSLSEGGTAEPQPKSGISEVANLADAFAQLRVRLALRTAERERAQSALRDAHRNLEALVSASPVAVIGMDPSGAVTEWNPAAERLLGLSRSEVLERDLAAVLEDEHGRPPRVVDLLPGSTFDGVEIRLRSRRLEVIDVAVWSASLRTEDASLQGSLVILADITERKRLDAERKRRLREQSQRAEAETVLDQFTFLAEATGDLSNSLDLDTTLQRAASVAVPKLADWCAVHLLSLGGDIETVAGTVADQGLESIVDQLQSRYPPTPDGSSAAAQALRSGHSIVVTEVSRVWLASIAVDSEHLHLLERLAPHSVMGIPLIARDRIFGALTFVSTRPDRRYDATSVALAEALARRCALAIDNARLHRETQDALHARETFLSIASHELGGPLARLKLHTEVLKLAHARQALDATLLSRSLGSIQRATNRLATITQDLLEVARWRAGDLSIRPSRLDLGKLVREFVTAYRDRISDGRRLTLHVARGRHMVIADVNRIEQVCENLLDNAFKYSPDGGSVQVSVRSEHGGVLLRVRDSGIGLPPGAHETIFEPFGRAGNAERRSVSGMGLGLYICRSIVERHGGRIWAESPGELEGTTLNVWIPGAPT